MQERSEKNACEKNLTRNFRLGRVEFFGEAKTARRQIPTTSIIPPQMNAPSPQFHAPFPPSKPAGRAAVLAQQAGEPAKKEKLTGATAIADVKMSPRLAAALAALEPLDENRLSGLAGRAESDAKGDALAEEDFRTRPDGVETADALAKSAASFGRVAEVLRALLDAHNAAKIGKEGTGQ